MMNSDASEPFQCESMLRAIARSKKGPLGLMFCAPPLSINIRMIGRNWLPYNSMHSLGWMPGHE
jgi:hypothetical protein